MEFNLRFQRHQRNGLDHYIPGGSVEHGHPSATHLAHHASLDESSQEIADLLDQPVGTVKTRIRLGMQKLRAALAAELKEQ